MGKTYYCHIPKGLGCSCERDGVCETWSFHKCEYKALTPRYEPPRYQTDYAMLKCENGVLKKRLEHLLQSEFIRKFDEKDIKTGEYKLDIKEADKEADLCERSKGYFRGYIDGTNNLLKEILEEERRCKNDGV